MCSGMRSGFVPLLLDRYVFRPTFVLFINIYVESKIVHQVNLLQTIQYYIENDVHNKFERQERIKYIG